MTDVADKDHPPSRPATATAASGGAVAAPARRSPAALPGHRSAVARIQSAYQAIPAGPAGPAGQVHLEPVPVPRRHAPGRAWTCRRSATSCTSTRSTRTAVAGGMTTYEDLADATLRHGLMPLVVPQLKTITLGGAVTGLGIESTSLRNGMPHESVLEMEILTGDGRVVTAAPDGEHDALYRGFPNSYGTLGYALSLTIELEPVTPFVHLRHFRFAGAGGVHGGGRRDRRRRQLRRAPGRLRRRHAVQPGRDVPDRRGVQRGGALAQRLHRRADLLPVDPRAAEDFLTIRDYLWRWDTDWFWCSRPFGVQQPADPPRPGRAGTAARTCTASWSPSTGGTA